MAIEPRVDTITNPNFNSTISYLNSTDNTNELRTINTKGAGDCAFHAALGEWDTEQQQFICRDVIAQRKRVANAIRKCKVGDQLSPLVQAAIKAIIMEGRSVDGEKIKQAQKNYRVYVSTQLPAKANAWDTFELTLRNYPEIIQYIDKFIEEYKTKKKSFQAKSHCAFHKLGRTIFHLLK